MILATCAYRGEQVVGWEMSIAAQRIMASTAGGRARSPAPGECAGAMVAGLRMMHSRPANASGRR